MDSVEVRQRFITYYENMGYQSLPRAPMIDSSIPMSFVMSAGLVQVENSLAKSKNRIGNRYVLVQECFRHFDLEKVGTDDIHLSLFEMPGAFVFGPDGKEGTVHKMWTLATEILGLEKERLWATYFNGGQVLNEYLPEDKTTREAWFKLDINNDHVVGLGTDNNFWMQGKGIDDSGSLRKCGPNTELFYDRGVERACDVKCKPGCKCGRFIEFSNSLFICSEIARDESSIQLLSDPFTETVIGTERVSMISQKASSVFDMIEFSPIMDILCDFTDNNIASEYSIAESIKIIADHLRALYFLISDGAPPPGKNGRERIIKMLMRRVITRLLILGVDVRSFLKEIALNLSATVPITNGKSNVQEIFTTYFLMEYQRFLKTIERGERQIALFLENNGGSYLSNAQMFCLEKQFGVPSLLTKSLLKNYQSMIHKKKSSPCKLTDLVRGR